MTETEPNPWSVVNHNGRVLFQCPTESHADETMRDLEICFLKHEYHLSNDIPWDQSEEKLPD